MPVILTCEHAVNTIPVRFLHLFGEANSILESHRGIDIGAYSLATDLAKAFDIPLFAGKVSRLLIELNRSIGHDQLFSEFTTTLSSAERKSLVDEYYYPFRNQVEQWIFNSKKPVVHLSMHSFTPVFNGVSRAVDIGILFDPARIFETTCCQRLQLALKQNLPSMCIQFNEPYQGIDDGFTTYLRTRFNDAAYAGIEIEVNQKYVGTDKFSSISGSLQNALREVMI